MNGVHGVPNSRFSADRQPSFQGDLAVITGPATAYHDGIVVRRAHHDHLEFEPRRVVVTADYFRGRWVYRSTVAVRRRASSGRVLREGLFSLRPSRSSSPGCGGLLASSGCPGQGRARESVAERRTDHGRLRGSPPLRSTARVHGARTGYWGGPGRGHVRGLASGRRAQDS